MKKRVQKFDPEKIKKFQSWDDLSKELFTPNEIREMEKKALERSRLRNELSNSISLIVAQYMVENNIGFNELVRRLHMSTATVSKILKGDANITLETVAEISCLIGKKIHFSV